MASNMDRTACTFSLPSGSVSGIDDGRGIDRIVGAPRFPPTTSRLRRSAAGGVTCGGARRRRRRSAMKAPFRLFGVPVRVEPLFPVIVALMGYRLKPLWVVFAWIPIVFINLLGHEMGHAIMFRIAGLRSAV